MSLMIVWAGAGPAVVALALCAWAIATARRNAGLVDIFWPLFFLAAASCFMVQTGVAPPRAAIVTALVTAWSLRLATHLAKRNWNAPEDRRYREIRERNEPGFAWKSLYLVFGLQGALAWLIAAPLAAAMSSLQPLGALDAIGAGLATFGIAFETIADTQLARFLSQRTGASEVMDSGLWRYSRHPNYFGEAITWWGFGLLAAGAGAWWSLYSPLAMTWLLLRVTGVTLLERGMASRRPAYADYARRTSAFIPWPPRNP